MGTSTLGTTDLPHTALATDLSYLMEGIDTAVAIYRTSNGALAYGPYTADSFFQPIKHAGDTFSDPQMNYDVMRDHWIVTYLEWTPGWPLVSGHRRQYIQLADTACARRTVS